MTMNSEYILLCKTEGTADNITDHGDNVYSVSAKDAEESCTGATKNTKLRLVKTTLKMNILDHNCRQCFWHDDAFCLPHLSCCPESDPGSCYISELVEP